jgi:hypothetical protein
MRRIESLCILLGVAVVGCASLLGPKRPSYAEQKAGPENCFRSYLMPARGVNAGATSAIATWYAALTPQIVETLAENANRSEFGDRVMAHAIAAGVPEADFLRGAHPDPVRACGVIWNHEDIGTYRFDNAASAARSVLRRAAFAACAREFDELAPKLAALAAETKQQLGTLTGEANPYLAWQVYHRAMTAQRALVPRKRPDDVPVFAYAGAPYVAFTDMMQRFANTPNAYLIAHWLGEVSPFPEYAHALVQPLQAPTDEDKLLYCALKLRERGPIFSDFSPEEAEKRFLHFDRTPLAAAAPTMRFSDFHPGKVVDKKMDGGDNFRIYQRPVTAVALKDGRGSVELTTVEHQQLRYDCKRVVRVTEQKDKSAIIAREEQCKIDDRVITNKLTLEVSSLPPGITLEPGDEVVFFAERTSNDQRNGSKPTAKGSASFYTTTATAKLMFLAQVRRGGALVFPASN